jgi:hypothetical protein
MFTLLSLFDTILFNAFQTFATINSPREFPFEIYFVCDVVDICNLLRMRMQQFVCKVCLTAVVDRPSVMTIDMEYYSMSMIMTAPLMYGAVTRWRALMVKHSLRLKLAYQLG